LNSVRKDGTAYVRFNNSTIPTKGDRVNFSERSELKFACTEPVEVYRGHWLKSPIMITSNLKRLPRCARNDGSIHHPCRHNPQPRTENRQRITDNPLINPQNLNTHSILP